MYDPALDPILLPNYCDAFPAPCSHPVAVHPYIATHPSRLFTILSQIVINLLPSILHRSPSIYIINNNLLLSILHQSPSMSTSDLQPGSYFCLSQADVLDIAPKPLCLVGEISLFAGGCSARCRICSSVGAGVAMQCTSCCGAGGAGGVSSGDICHPPYLWPRLSSAP